MRLTHSLMALAVASALVAAPAAAQSGAVSAASVVEARVQGAAGVVFGEVRESVRGAALPGARIRINGVETTTASDGSFRVAGLPAGTHAISVDYLGYQPLADRITVGADGGLRVEISLVSTVDTSTTLGRIEVRATRDAQALALNQQRVSDNYRNVVSADLLGRFPDTNLAEATQRIPGVSIERDQGEGRYVNVRGAPLEFTSVSVDGVQLASPNASRRAVELDTIPADVISALEVTKALTPDMDGDAIAGQINIVTQSALDGDDLILRGSAGAGEYELGSGKNQRANLTIGNRFGADRNIGVLIAASGSRSGRFTDNVETAFFRDEDGRILPETTEIKDYEGERTRTGVTGRFDFRLDADNLFYFIASNSRFKDHEFRDTLAIEYERHTDDSTEFAGTAGRATFDKELRERTQAQRIRTFNLGGEHYAGNDWKIDWQASRSTGILEVSPRMQYIFRSSVRPQLEYDYANPDFPSWRIVGADGAPESGVNLPEDWYAFRRLNDRYEYAKENETGLRLDFSRPQTFLGDSGDLRFGVRARLRDKDSNDDRRRNGDAGDFASLGIGYSDMLCDSWSNNFDYFLTGRRFCRDIFSRYAEALRESPNHNVLVPDSITNDYRAEEDIHATYVRLDARWDKLSMVGGLRYERTATSGEAAYYDLDEETAVVQRVERDYVKLLPSLHFRYEFDPDSILRWSYSTGISRPNFTNTVPRLVISDNDREIEGGNPELKATYSHNLDVSYEHYLRPLGLLSVAAFYKRLDDPIFVTNSTVAGGPYDGLRLTRAENGADGRILGLELAWQQTFDFLPAPFDGLGVYANYTYADSRAELPFGAGRTDLPGTSKHNANVALFYEKHGFNARIAWNHRSKYIQEFDVLDPDFNVFWDERSILDFSTSYQFSPNWQVFGEINNITDSRQRRFQGQDNRVLELEQFGRFWLAGVRFEY
ncbi:TonB-dependent receptor [Coralloluteibacterium thermophilus]|uniref:TonB-dependent receptor n=1 Tax=Coralloluteibacterium thermophilum TaxID=2707049 RepID=A0ABV9NNF2_9GAMM